MPLYNKHGAIRICSRCPNEAVQQVKHEWLCPECLEKRRARQAETVKQRKCACGAVCRLGAVMCSRCEDKEEAANSLAFQISQIQDIEDVKAFLLEHLT
jgi:rubredoxin